MKKISYLIAGLAMMMMSSPSYATTPSAPPATVSSFIDIKFTPNSTNPIYNYKGAVTYDGAVTVGQASDVWNIFEPDLVAGITQPLVLTSGWSGYPTGQSLTFTAEGATSLKGSTSGFYGGGSGEYAKLMNSYTYVETGDNGTFIIGGLQGNTNYDVYVLTQGNKGDTGSKLQLTGLNSSGVSTTFTQSGTSNSANNSFLSGQNYMLQTFRTDVGGILTIGYSSANGHNAIVNGMQILGSSNNTPGATPEPASMLLIGVGGALISAAKLRKKKSAENPVA